MCAASAASPSGGPPHIGSALVARNSALCSCINRSSLPTEDCRQPSVSVVTLWRAFIHYRPGSASLFRACSNLCDNAATPISGASMKITAVQGGVLPSCSRVRNALYALSPDDLSVRAVYKTGPENDSTLCPPYPLPCGYSRNVTDNYNRILLQVGTKPLVLACGATSQGMCSIHDPLRGLNVTASMDKNLTDNYVASRHSTVAFFRIR
ncbi:hypothetical protein MTO96_049502 [Rhipicephalus appendiculatus]